MNRANYTYILNNVELATIESTRECAQIVARVVADNLGLSGQLRLVARNLPVTHTGECVRSRTGKADVVAQAAAYVLRHDNVVALATDAESGAAVYVKAAPNGLLYI